MKKFVFLFVTFFMWGQELKASVDCATAESFMTQIGEKVVNLLTDKSISDQERANQFRQILEQKFNIKAIGKFVLGRYWKQANEAEKEKFLSLFKETTVASYATRFKNYTSEKFEVLGSRKESDGGVVVLTKIERPHGAPILIDWKIFEKNGQLKIYDVILEGISMGITQRSEFASVIQKAGGSIASLNQALEKKLISPRV